MNFTSEKSSFDYLREISEILNETYQGRDGIVFTATAIELTLQAMNPKIRRRIWNYLRKARKAMADEIFEDENDYVALIKEMQIRI